jgi:1-acyl-sn-glycerol-3-phosphate acyltransferase
LFYWLVKYVTLGPLMRIMYRPRAQGLDNVPTEGPVIIACNHLSFMDSLFLPLVIPREVVFLGKAEYFDKARTRWFFKAAHVIPIRRESGSAAEAALQAGVEVLEGGGALGIYPEGTRSPDGRLYRGKVGVARMALEAGCPVVPVCMFGTREIQPPEQRRPNLRGRVRVVFGEPLTFEEYAGRSRDKVALRAVTDEIIYEIMQLSGQEYVDEYASRVKARGGEAPASTEHPAAQSSSDTHPEPRPTDVAVTDTREEKAP